MQRFSSLKRQQPGLSITFWNDARVPRTSFDLLFMVWLLRALVGLGVILSMLLISTSEKAQRSDDVSSGLAVWVKATRGTITQSSIVS